jgi:hypothetical protein
VSGRREVFWRPCPSCGEQRFIDAWERRCDTCSRAIREVRHQAWRAMRKAIHEKRLVPFHGFHCADCGKPAEAYEHRSYLLPLAVEPICNRCNLRRGPALEYSPGAIEHIDLGGLAA